MNPTPTLLIALLFTTLTAFATTWDEPWHEDVVKGAEHFVLAKVVDSESSEAITVAVVKTLAGPSVEGEIEINGFYALELCSWSDGHGPEFHFDGVDECYFFIRKNDKGHYSIATPTSGYAYVEEGKVYATYRHSYHQALVDADTYEETMAAVFNRYHNIPYDEASIIAFVARYLALPPAGFEPDEIDTFFAQHVALECAYHLRLPDLYPQLLPFLGDTLNFHNQTSAARALIGYNTDACKDELLKLISDTTAVPFVQVICIQTLTAFRPQALKEQLIEAAKTASTDSNGFGGNLMDPRICTFLPSVKDALQTLIEEL